MTANQVLTILASVLMFTFAALVLLRYWRRRGIHNLFWGIGLAMFALASMAGAMLTVDWSPVSFFAWYYFGALLTAAWIGQGTVYLQMSRNRAHILSAVLVMSSIIAAVMLISVMPQLDISGFSPTFPISEQYRDIMPPIGEGGIVRLATPFFNVYGLVAIVGGALWSSYLFWRKRQYPNRVVGNLLIAAGAIVIASAGLLTRIGLGHVLYVGELLAAVLMFSGFLVASSPRSESIREGQAPASVR